jgi:hypothetical protein
MVGKDREPPFAKINLVDAKLVLLSIERLSTELEVLHHLRDSLDSLSVSLRTAIAKAELAIQHRRDDLKPNMEGARDGTKVVING